MQTARGLQVESVAATPYLLAAAFRDGRLPLDVPPGQSMLVVGRGAGLVAGAAPVVMLVLLAAVYVGVWHSRRSLRSDLSWTAPASLAVMLAAMSGNKVLSPQHLLWTLPLVALCLVDRRTLPRLAGVLMLAALVLTQIEYPALYALLPEHAVAPLVAISARNALLVAAFVLATVAVWRARTAALEPGSVADDEASAARRRDAAASGAAAASAAID